MYQKWTRFRDPVAFGLDAKRFDQHCSIAALMYEHAIYNGIFGSSLLRMLLSWQLVNRGKGVMADGKVSYEVKGRRMSGDMNTGIGNCILMCALVLSYMKENKISAEFVNNGDDGVVICERADLAKFDGLFSYVKDRGFYLELEKPVDILERVVFCQTQPVFDGTSWIMVRQPKTAIAKDLVVAHPVRDKREWGELLRANGLGGLALTGGIPVFQSFYKCLVGNVSARAQNNHSKTMHSQTNQTRVGPRSRTAKPITSNASGGGDRSDSEKHWHNILGNSGRDYMTEGMTRTERQIHPDARVSFYYAFGILPDTQREIETIFDNAVIHDGQVKFVEQQLTQLFG
jgi:hypothetical protein